MTGAALAVLVLLVLAAAPAAAGFRYVPAARDGGVATTPAEAGQAVPASGPGRAVWRIHAGETLRAALSRWGARAGTDVTFLTDRRYRLDAAAAFEGAFGNAVETLLQGLNHLPHPPEGALSADGGSLAVTHRTRNAGEGESKP